MHKLKKITRNQVMMPQLLLKPLLIQLGKQHKLMIICQQETNKMYRLHLTLLHLNWPLQRLHMMQPKQL